MTPTYAKLLPQFISYKSVSTDPKFMPEIEKVVAWLSDQFHDRGFEVKTIKGYGNPIVVARFTVSPKAETVLIYGHYDVQPAERAEGWDSDPFSVTEKNGRLVARGSVDNKGQVLVHIATVFDLIAERKLRYNVVFMIEGNEETGSPRLSDFVKDHAELIKADFALISDGETTGGRPTLDVGFRGVINLQLTLSTSDRELHSGLFGGAVPNAAQELINLVTGFYDKHRRVTLPGFYDGAVPVDEVLMRETRKFPVDQSEMLKLTGAIQLLLPKRVNFFAKTGLFPTLEVTGFKTGYTEPGFKNSVPPVAQAKINVRTAPMQDAFALAEIIADAIQARVPQYCRLELIKDEISRGIMLSRSHVYMKRAKAVMDSVYGVKAVFKYCGGTLPIAVDFHDLLKIPQVYASIGNEDCFMHAANENFSLEFLGKALNFSRAFLMKD